MRSLGCLLQVGEKSLWALAFWAQLLQSGPGEAFPEPDTRKPAGQDCPQGPGTLGTVAPPSTLPLAVGRVPQAQKLPAAAFRDPQRWDVSLALPLLLALGVDLIDVSTALGASRCPVWRWAPVPRPEGPDNLCPLPSPTDRGAEQTLGSRQQRPLPRDIAGLGRAGRGEAWLCTKEG